MGIDIYLRWKNQTQEEKEKQYTGFDIGSGNVGYLREAYHGDPYATRVLVPEAFRGGGAKISVETMKKRLEKTIEVAIEREKTIYKEKNVTRNTPCVKSFIDFVELAEKKEKETGEPCTVIASY